jgi:phenylalanyl-tRNA synthetase beta chain
VRLNIVTSLQDEPLPEQLSSLGVEVTFQPRDRSLTEARIEQASAKVLPAVMKATKLW